MGAVYKARQPLLEPDCGPENYSARPRSPSARISGIASTPRGPAPLAKLNHPNIVMVYEFGQLNGQPYFFVMEYVDGPEPAPTGTGGAKLDAARGVCRSSPQICEAAPISPTTPAIVHPGQSKPDNISARQEKGRVKNRRFRHPPKFWGRRKTRPFP